MRLSAQGPCGVSLNALPLAASAGRGLVKSEILHVPAAAAAAHCEYSCANMEVTLLVKQFILFGKCTFSNLRFIGSSPKFVHLLRT